MMCYECNKINEISDTVAICVICGRGICRNHLVRAETPLWDGEYDIKLKCGMDVECKIEDINPLKKILCTSCNRALKENY